MRHNRIILLVIICISPFLAASLQSPGDSDPQQEPICYWELVETKEAIASGSGGLSATRNGNSISTANTVPGSENCGGFKFQTSHSWTEPPFYLAPGEILAFTVDASWSTSGDTGCGSMVTGLTTWIAMGATTIKARQSSVIPSSQPSGSVSSGGEWTVPSGKAEGSELSIRAHGEQGGAGGTVTYVYRYVCDAAPEAGDGSCEPIVSGISGLEPGDVLSPAAYFVTEEGNAATVIGSAWFINGKQSSSVVWDGKETALELQYTCADHSGHSRTYIIPAYQGAAVSGTASGGQDTAPDDKGGMKRGTAAAGLAAGIAGAGASGAALLKNKKKIPIKPEKKIPQKHSDKGKTRKDLLDTETEAISNYKQSLEKMSGNVDRAINAVRDMPGVSSATKCRLIKQLKSYKESLDNVAAKAGNITDKLEGLQKLRDDLRTAGKKYRQLQKAHQKAFEELQELPEDAAHQLADLTTAIEGFGLAADEALKRVPLLNRVYSEKNFQVMRSFSEFARGTRRNLSKTVFRSAVEGKKNLTIQERIDFGERGLERRQDPEWQRMMRERKRMQAKRAKNSPWRKLSEYFFGKGG